MPLTLRAYQVRVFRVICDTTEDVLVQLPTGSGKTLLLSAAVASLLQKGAVTHTVIACPQLHIAEGFLGWAAGPVACGAEVVRLGPESIRPLEESAKTAQIIDYLQPAARGYAIAVSHQSVSNVPAEALPPSLTGYLLVIDEAHHAAIETRLGRFLANWRARGGRVVSATATDFRADGQSVRLDGMRLVRRALAEHMRDRDPPGPYAPERVESEIVGVEMPGPVTADEVEGKELPHEEQQHRMVIRMVERWEELGRPKTMVKVPILDGGSSSLVGLLVQSYQAAGARVYDAAGVGAERQQQFIHFLAEQRQLAEYADAHDVVIGVQRVIEGTDWPWCSDVFVVGIPRSLVQTIQLLGRATRHKHWGSYDSRFRDRARITFFVPTQEGSAMSSLDLGHSRKVLALLAFMADTETGLQWVLFDQIRAGLLQGLSDRRRRAGETEGTGGAAADEAGAADIISRLVEGIDPRYEGIARTVLAAIREEAGGRDQSAGEVLDRLRAHDLIRAIPEEERVELLPQLVLRAMEAADPTGRVRRRVRQAVADRVAAGRVPVGREDLAAVWEEVVAEFREETMPTLPDQDRFDRFLHQLTGGTITAFADRLTERYKAVIGSPIAIEDIHDEVWTFYEREGRWPSTHSGLIDRFGIAYSSLNIYLNQGWRGLPAGSSVYQECCKVAAAKGVPIEDRSP
ncbi:MAG: DEAD/DEAH box helicase family protein, partial [Gemmataceae bacterium]